MALFKQAILLVEDNVDDEALSLRAIRKCGIPCQVRVLRDGILALEEIVTNSGPPPDLIVLDFHLPGVSGLDLLRALRQQPYTKRVPIVILSSLASPSEMEACLDEGASSCVQKPRDPHEYVEQVGLIVQYWFTVDGRSHELS